MPDNILNGCGCVECGKEKIRNKFIKTHEQYVEELKQINPNIVIIEKYKKANVPVLHKCLIDEYEWKASPGNILYGKGCPKCAKNIKISHDEYVKKVSEINQNIEVLEEYINVNTPILHYCKIHDIKWRVCPICILKGTGCIECGKEKLSKKNTKTHEQYIKELKEINPNIIPIEKYINSNTNILHKCLIDDYEWYVSPLHTLSGNGCPQCNESKGERQIRLWLNKFDIAYEREYRFDDCRDIKPLPFDFYLPSYNSCIEYQGKQHYHPIDYFGGKKHLEYVQRHDDIKKEYCKNKGISLLHIPYNKNVEEELNNFLFI